VSKSVKIPPLTRFSQLAEPVVEKRQERRRAHLDADGGAAELVVSLVIMLYIMVTSRALHHRAVTSERVESESSSTWPWSPWATFSTVRVRMAAMLDLCCPAYRH
jgi:hypothetical protein